MSDDGTTTIVESLETVPVAVAVENSVSDSFKMFVLRSDGTSIYISSPETVVCLFRPMKILLSAFVYITTRQL